MIARHMLWRALGEIENYGDEKINHDAENQNHARVESNDAEKLPEPANMNTEHQPWLVWIPARSAVGKPIL